MITVNYQEMEGLYHEKGYPFFQKPFDLNVFGIRADNLIAGMFDDTIGVVWRDDHGELWVFQCPGTTDPGAYYLGSPMNPNGTAILVPGYYRRMWRPGMHRDKYMALKQYNKCRVYRDNNRDNRLDMNVQTVEEGVFGINLHRAKNVGKTLRVGAYSAGCQVVQNAHDLEYILSLVKVQKKWIGTDWVSYALFEERDVG